jgi:phosphate transport system substrate-binding protein
MLQSRLWWICLAMLLIGCAGKEDKPKDRYDRGTIYVSCDESFKPVIDAQVEVYEASYPDAHIVVSYKPEAECLKDLNVDSVRMIIATRGYSEKEKRYLIDSLHVAPEALTIARDLIAVVVNKSAPDTFFSMNEIRDLVSGKLKRNLIPVFDGTRATSTVRFMIDSVLKGGSLGSNVMAASNTWGVIDYVSKTPNAVGFVGYSWIGNDEDSAQVAERNKIKIAWVESKDSANAYVKPSQFFIYTKSYPMIRDLVYVLKENYNGLGRGFADFLSGERGQLIFRRAYLMPAVNPFYLRRAQQINK